MDNEKKFYVYKITNIINNKLYIGKSTIGIDRFKRHKEIATQKPPNCYFHIHKALNKYGFDNFTFEILEYFYLENDAYDAENKYIKSLNTMSRNGCGYNLNDGGRRAKHTPESIKKISDSHKGFKYTEESKKKMRESHLGVPSASLKLFLINMECLNSN
jgi:group I intron endonuclease